MSPREPDTTQIEHILRSAAGFEPAESPVDFVRAALSRRRSRTARIGRVLGATGAAAVAIAVVILTAVASLPRQHRQTQSSSIAGMRKSSTDNQRVAEAPKIGKETLLAQDQSGAGRIAQHRIVDAAASKHTALHRPRGFARRTGSVPRAIWQVEYIRKESAGLIASAVVLREIDTEAAPQLHDALIEVPLAQRTTRFASAADLNATSGHSDANEETP